jgi:hypothetical protein
MSINKIVMMGDIVNGVIIILGLLGIDIISYW